MNFTRGTVLSALVLNQGDAIFGENGSHTCLYMWLHLWVSIFFNPFHTSMFECGKMDIQEMINDQRTAMLCYSRLVNGTTINFDNAHSKRHNVVYESLLFTLVENPRWIIILL